MPSMKALLNAAVEAEQKGKIPLFVTEPHSKWLEIPEEDRLYTDEALAFIEQALRKQFKRPRDHRFSASSMGECERRILFGYAGAPQLPVPPDTLDLMGLGEWGHLRWQAEGLSMGYMSQGEVWLHDKGLRIGGSADAILSDNSVFELKTVRSQKYAKITRDLEPVYAHRLQAEAYMMMGGYWAVSLVYEDRDSGAFHEFRFARDDAVERDLLERLAKLNRFVDLDALPEMLYDCEAKVGFTYKACPYRKHCPTRGLALGLAS